MITNVGSLFLLSVKFQHLLPGPLCLLRTYLLGTLRQKNIFARIPQSELVVALPQSFAAQNHKLKTKSLVGTQICCLGK